IIITAYATVESAVEAMKEGAYDYIVKPFNPEELSLILRRIVEHQRLIKENISLRKKLSKQVFFEDIVTRDKKMKKIIEMVKTVAPTTTTVLISGESGTGKELIARAIHNTSQRKKRPFIAISCGALPDSLLEAELFGYEKGAFTGATAQVKGKIELADRGTLFLDDIADISKKTQVDLLRIIQERELRRLGGSQIIKVDVRFIAATNRNLESEVSKGNFREDLYYRLKVITINIPPLRDRKDDIPYLVSNFIENFNAQMGKQILRPSERTMKILMGYNWPGNIRELENVIEHAMVICDQEIIEPQHLPEELIKNRTRMKTLYEMEREYIASVLNTYQWKITQAARVLGLTRSTLYNKIRKYDLSKK
ncbi:MAG TPA: sigma-54-dependent Fis family transcriptional regulator, partial [bacterium (Candidatus Stahlbacteria)]|nr:sigma-54-dependent Fis family transcriptional regulator [Candidatus Stahlbacteria bacterium]